MEDAANDAADRGLLRVVDAVRGNTAADEHRRRLAARRTLVGAQSWRMFVSFIRHLCSDRRLAHGRLRNMVPSTAVVTHGQAIRYARNTVAAENAAIAAAGNMHPEFAWKIRFADVIAAMVHMLTPIDVVDGRVYVLRDMDGRIMMEVQALHRRTIMNYFGDWRADMPRVGSDQFKERIAEINRPVTLRLITRSYEQGRTLRLTDNEIRDRYDSDPGPGHIGRFRLVGRMCSVALRDDAHLNGPNMYWLSPRPPYGFDIEVAFRNSMSTAGISQILNTIGRGGSTSTGQWSATNFAKRLLKAPLIGGLAMVTEGGFVDRAAAAAALG
jgi:hypothetical protein